MAAVVPVVVLDVPKRPINGYVHSRRNKERLTLLPRFLHPLNHPAFRAGEHRNISAFVWLCYPITLVFSDEFALSFCREHRS